MTRPRFRTVRFGHGYDMEEVDRFLDQAERVVRSGDGSLTPEEVLEKRFTPTRFAEGYDMDEVDNHLDNVIVPQLGDAPEAAPGPTGSASAPQPGSAPASKPGAERADPTAAAGPGSVLHPAEPRPGLLRRLFGGGR